MKKNLLLSIIILVMSGCKPQQKVSKESSDNAATQVAPQPHDAAVAHVFIYKTKKDYSNNVPVVLSDDKTQIVSYPHPSDLFTGGKLALPTPLHNDYWLDNRGIHKNIAFLKFTYAAYSQLGEAPSVQDLQNSIIDKDPITELWDCGYKGDLTLLQQQLNEWIDANKLPEKCKRIK